MLCLRHSTYGATDTEYLDILDIPIFVFNLTLTLILWSQFLTSLHVPLAERDFGRSQSAYFL
jgi:hypothetical protein